MMDRRFFLGTASAAAVSACATIAPRRTPAPAIDAAVPARYNGVVAVGRRGHVETVHTFGLADVEARVPITRHTRFALGSGTKWLVSAAVLRLVDQGRLTLDRPIGGWLPEVGTQAGAAVTMRHLLTNRSGIADRLSQGLKADPSLRSASDSALAMIRRLKVGDLVAPPGTQWDYSPFNWVIVRALVERITDVPLESAVRGLLFAPLGLASAVLASDGFEHVPDMAAAYRTVAPPVRKMRPVPGFVAASGNAVMTPGDAIRAAHGIFATRFLSAGSRAELTRVEVAEEDYALGGRVHQIGGRRWAWETGKVEGYRALIAHDLEHDRTIVAFGNDDRVQDAIAAMVEAIAEG